MFKIHKILQRSVSMLLCILLFLTAIPTPSSAEEIQPRGGAGGGNINYPSSGGSAGTNAVSGEGIYLSLVSFCDRDTGEVLFSFTVGHGINKDFLRNCFTYKDLRTNAPASKTTLIADLDKGTGSNLYNHKLPDGIVYDIFPMDTFIDESEGTSIKVFPQVGKYSKTQGYNGMHTNIDQAIKWSVSTASTPDGNPHLFNWLYHFQDKINSAARKAGVEDKVVDVDNGLLPYDDGNLVMTVEPLLVYSPVPGWVHPSSAGVSNLPDDRHHTAALTTTHIGVSEVVPNGRYPFSGYDLYPVGSLVGGTRAWMTSVAPIMLNAITTSAVLMRDSFKPFQNSGELGVGEIPHMNIGIFKDKAEAETYLNFGKGKTFSPYNLIKYGGVWLAFTPQDWYNPPNTINMNTPKTDFKIEKPEIVEFDQSTGRMVLDISGGYNPITPEYTWRYPEIKKDIFAVTSTAKMKNLLNHNNQPYPAELGVDSTYDKESSTAGDGSYKDLLKNANSNIISDEVKSQLESTLGSISTETEPIGSDKLISQYLAGMSQKDFSKKTPYGATEYPGMRNVVENKVRSRLAGIVDDKIIKNIAGLINSISVELPTYNETKFKDMYDSPSYGSLFGTDDRVTIKVIGYTDTGIKLFEEEKHLKDIALDNGYTDYNQVDLFSTYTPLNLMTPGNADKYLVIEGLTTANHPEMATAGGVIVEARINWVDADNQKQHFYWGDQYWKRTETLPDVSPEGLGWSNNVAKTDVVLEKSNLKAVEITPTWTGQDEHLDDKDRVIGYTNYFKAEATGIVDTLVTPTVNTTHTLIAYVQDNYGNLTEINRVSQVVNNLKEGDEVHLTITGSHYVDYRDESKILFVYEINPTRKEPIEETTFNDNKISAGLNYSNAVDWIAKNITYDVTEKSSTDKAKTYDISLNGVSTLQTNRKAYNAIQDIYISYDDGDNKNWTKVASKETGNTTVGGSMTAVLRNISVPANKTKIVFIRYTINLPLANPLYELKVNNNTVETAVVLGGPIPEDQTIGFPKLTCSFTLSGYDTQFNAVPTGTFIEDRPITEQYGRLVNIRYNGNYRSSVYSCDSGEDSKGNPTDEANNYGNGISGGSSSSQSNERNGIDDAVEQYWKGSTTYTTRYLRGKSPTKDPNDTINKYSNKTNLDLVEYVQTVDYCEGDSWTSHHTHYVGTDSEGNSIYDHCYDTHVDSYSLSPIQTKEFTVKFDEEYTYNDSSSRTYSTEAQGTKYDKQITAGKGFQQTIRVRILTDYPGDFDFSGATVYSMATGAGNHNKNPLNVVKLEPTSQITSSIDKVQRLNFPLASGSPKGARVEYHDKMERYVTFQLVKNPKSVNGIREAYTSVNYPDSYLTPENNKPAPKSHITDYMGLKTYSIITINNVTPTDTSSDLQRGIRFGICYKDNMIVLSNYHNDTWAKPVDRN